MGPVGGGKSTIVSCSSAAWRRTRRTEDGRGLRDQGLPDARGAAAPDPARAARRTSSRSTASTSRATSARAAATTLEHTVRRASIERRAGRSASPSPRRTASASAPSRRRDPKSQDISELTGGIDLSTIGESASESDPRAYRFDGELNIANRGMMEFVEMLKCDEKFLYVLLTLSQEQNIKTGRFAMIYADEVIVSHTNENEYSSVRRQQEVGGAAGPHHPGQGALQPARQRRGADLREAAASRARCRTSTSRRTRCGSPASSPS